MSSNPAPFLSTRSSLLDLGRSFARMSLVACALCAASVNAQDDAAVTPPPEDVAGEGPAAGEEGEPREDPSPSRINLAVTVPSGEVNEAQAQQCVDEADAGQISGEIIVCRRLGQSGENSLSGSRAEAQKRYAEETAFKDAPRTPNVSGLPDNGRGISVGKVPPPALIIDVEALPDAPAGSDADRIARGLPPLGQDENLTEEEIRKRREKLGLPPPAFEKQPN
ncbi:MAG: hypothetical protein AAGA34_15630 [Pseudomonadota bacterium]